MLEVSSQSDSLLESTRLDLLNAVLGEARELFAQHALFYSTQVEKYLVINKHSSAEAVKQKLRFFTSKVRALYLLSSPTRSRIAVGGTVAAVQGAFR